MARFIIYVILWALCSIWYHVDRDDIYTLQDYIHDMYEVEY